MVEEGMGGGVVLVDGPLLINNIDKKEKKIYTYINIIPGKKAASWQLGLKTMQSGIKRRKIIKIKLKSKE